MLIIMAFYCTIYLEPPAMVFTSLSTLCTFSSSSDLGESRQLLSLQSLPEELLLMILRLLPLEDLHLGMALVTDRFTCKIYLINIDRNSSYLES